MKKVFAKSGKRILTPPKAKTNPAQQNKTAKPPQIILDPGRDYGPAMAKLTDNRKRFVLAYVWTGGRNGQRAALLAGVGGNEANAATAACHLLRNDSVLEAIREEADKYWRAGVLKCAVELDKLIDSENERVKLDAIKAYLGYAGVIVAQHVTVKHEHSLEDLSGDELLARLVELRAKNNLIEYKPTLEGGGEPDPALAGVAYNDAVLDGEFVPLEEAA